MKILLVEDDMEINAMLKSFLMTENYEVIAVSDGESACEKFFSDDYIAKPFSMTEVLARIKANIRRTTQYASGTSMQQPILIKGALTMDLNAYSVKKDGKEMYQRFAFRRGIQAKLMQISRKLEEILKSDSDEKVMVFTDEPVLRTEP